MRLGAHVSTSKPFSDAITRAQEFGCDCIQIFANPPQRWNPAVISDVEIEKFNQLNKVASINPIIIHSIYLINLASENPFYYSQSVASLIDDMKKAKKIGALGVNTHLGSTKGRELSEVITKIELAIKDILAATDGDNTYFIIENSAGAGNIIGDTLEEIDQIVKAINSSRIKVLIDTAHAFESGYDLRNKSDVDKFVADFDTKIGLDRLVGFHFNDSKTAQSSHRDRHADLGHGEIGLSAFENIINHPRLKDLFGILETPQDEISWAEQIKMLRNMEKK